MKKRMTALFALSLFATSCAGSDSSKKPADDPAASDGKASSAAPIDGSENPEPSAPANDATARKELRTAFVRLARSNTGKFTVSVPLGGSSGVQEKGQYQLEPVASDVVRNITTPEGILRVAYRVVGDQGWIRLAEASASDGTSNSWPCWVDFADLAKLTADIGELPASPVGQPPAAVVAASYAIGRQRVTPQRISGTTDLVLAAGLVSGKLVLASGLDVSSDATVPASFLVEGKDLIGFTVELADLPEAIEVAVGDVPPEIMSLESEPGAITTFYKAVGAPVDIEAPPADEILRVTTEGDFEAAMNACGR